MSKKAATDPYWKELDAISCPECANLPADSRVIARVDLGGGILEQRIFCDQCGGVYSVTLTKVTK